MAWSDDARAMYHAGPPRTATAKEMGAFYRAREAVNRLHDSLFPADED